MTIVISLLQKALSEKNWELVNEAISILSEEKENDRVPSKNSIQPRRNSPRPRMINKFDPNEFYVNEEPEMKKFNDNVKPVPRNRPPAKFIEQKCSVCGKIVQVPKALSKDNFRCDNCLFKIIKK